MTKQAIRKNFDFFGEIEDRKIFDPKSLGIRVGSKVSSIFLGESPNSRPEVTIFDLIDAIEEDNQIKARKVIYSLADESGDFHPLAILASLHKNFRTFLAVILMKKQGEDERAIQKILQISPFHFNCCLKLYFLPLEAFKEIFLLFLETESSLKMGEQPIKSVFELAILRIITIIRVYRGKYATAR